MRTSIAFLFISLLFFSFFTKSSTNENLFLEKNASPLLKSRIKGLILIEEPSEEDLSKSIKNFEINLRGKEMNPMDELSSETTTSEETTSNQAEKEENMIKNSNMTKYTTESKVLGGETQENIKNITETAKEEGKEEKEAGVIEKDYEEKTKVFHLIPEDLETSKEKRPDISSFYSILFVGLLCTLALLIIALRNFFQKYFELYILNTLKFILMDIIILISVITTIELLYYHGVFDSFIESIDIYGICLAFSMFAILWLFISALYTIIFQFFINKWNEYELLFNEQDVLLNQFKNLINRRNDALQNNEYVPSQILSEISEKSKQIQYILMRQSFIAPSFLPTVSEGFLRDDFNFSEYLGRVLSKTFTKGFVFSIASFIFLLGFIYFWTLFSLVPSKSIQIIFIVIIPFVTIGFLIAIRRRINRIQTVLIGEVKEHLDVFFANFTQKRDPFIDFVQSTPLYLERENELREKKIQDSLLGGMKIPNKHENLFPLNSPLFTLKCVMFCLLSLVIWVIISYSQHIKLLSISRTSIFFFVLANIISIVSTFYLIPTILKDLSIISNIGMLKDQKIIQEVVISQRNLVTPRFAKLYRLFKSIRKQLMNQEESPAVERGFKAALDNQMKVIRDQTLEYFAVLAPKQNGDLDLGNLIKLTHLCGHDLSIDELVFLAREASTNGQDTNSENFLRAVYLMAEDVKLDPYKTSKEILLKLKLDENEEEGDLMAINDFKNILQEHKTLLKDDIDIILNEIYYISDDGKYFSLDKLACLIRDSIEGLAR